MSDERLARRAVAGDERAFAAIFRRYNQDLYRYCLAILGNPADAQDALQNAMVKALRALPGEQREVKLKPWLYRVAHNEAVELLRQRRVEQLDPETAAPDPGVAETVEARERLRRLFTDLAQLPERQRSALVMRELSGLDFEEIGDVLGTSAATSRQTVYEARLGLREMEAGREMSCDTVTKALSDGDGRTLRRRDVRAHLRACPQCRGFGAEIDSRRRDFAALSPLPALAAAALLKGALGSAAGGGSATGASLGGGAAAGATAAAGPMTGGAAAGGGAAITGAAGGAAGAVGGIGVAAKAAATVAVVAALGVGAADRAGLVRVTGSGGDGTAETAPATAAGANAPAGSDATGATGPAEPASQPSGPPSSPDGGSAGAPASKNGGDTPSPTANGRREGDQSGEQDGKPRHANAKGAGNSAKGGGSAPSGRGNSAEAGRSPGNGKGGGGSAGERGKGAGGDPKGSAGHGGAGQPSKDRDEATAPQAASGKQTKGGPVTGSAPVPSGKQTAPKAEPPQSPPEAPALPDGQAKQAKSPAPERGDAGPPAGAVETSP